MNRQNIFSLIGNVTMAGLQFLSNLVLYWIFSKVVVGNWLICVSAIGVVEAVRSGIVQSALIRFHAGARPEDARSIIGAAWLISLTLTFGFILVNLVLLLCIPGFTDAGWFLFQQYFSIAVICSLPYNFSTWLLQSEQRFKPIIFLRIIAIGGFLLGLFFSKSINHDSPKDILICYSGGMLAASVFALCMRYTQILSIVKTSRSFVSQLLNFGVYSMGTGVSAILLRASDSFLIGAFLGPAAVAVYSVPQKIIEFIQLPITSFANTALPAMAIHANKGEFNGVSRIMNKYAGTLTVCLLPLILLIFFLSHPIVGLLFGKGYAESVVVLQVFMIYAALLPIDRFLGMTLDIMNRPQLNFLKTLFMLFVNITGDIIGIYIFKNVISVAAASIFTFLAGIIFGHFALRRHLKYNLFEMIKTGCLEGIFMLGLVVRKLRLNN